MTTQFIGTGADQVPVNGMLGNMAFQSKEAVSVDALTCPVVTGPTVLTADSTSAALTVTQTGTGHALVVEDSASPDSTPIVFDTNGQLGIGGAPTASVSLDISKSLGIGASTAYGVWQRGVTAPTTTSSSVGFVSTTSTASNGAVGYTVSAVLGFQVAQGTIHADSTVTNQYGFNVASSLIGATNNYAFYSNIPSGTGRWNFYANGSADNYFGGKTGFGVNTPTAKVEIAANNTGVLTAAGNNSIRFVDTDTSTAANQPIGVTEYYSSDTDAPSVRAIAGVFADSGVDSSSSYRWYNIPAGGGAQVEQMRLNSVGNLGINVAPSAGAKVHISGTINDSTTGYATYINSLFGTAVTSAAYGTRTQLRLDSAPHSTGNIYHYSAGLSSIGGATVTNHYGFLAESTISGATNNYGFYSAMSAAAGKWSFYSPSGAESFSAGRWYIGTTASTSPWLVANTGLVMNGKNVLIDTQAAQIGNGAPAMYIRHQGNYASNNSLGIFHIPYENGAIYELFGDSTGATLGYIIDNLAGGVNYNTTSDYRLKKDVETLIGSGDFIDALKPRTFTWIESGKAAAGFIAHELQEVCPTAVSGVKDAVDSDGKIMPQGVDASSGEIMANIIAELQSLRARVAELEAKQL